MRASVHSHVEPVADPCAAPITIRCRRQVLLGGFLLTIAGLWIAVPLKALLVDASAGVPGLGVLGALGATMIGAALALLALSWIVRCRVWVIEQGLIRMTERRLTGVRAWEESLARYRGVSCRYERRSNRYGARSWYVVEAGHPEPAKTVELARSNDPHLIELCAETWARRLGLPLC
jgi:hypothetical protein